MEVINKNFTANILSKSVKGHERLVRNLESCSAVPWNLGLLPDRGILQYLSNRKTGKNQTILLGYFKTIIIMVFPLI